MYPDFQNYWIEAVERIVASNEAIDENFSEAVRRQACLLAGIDPSDFLYWFEHH